MLKSNSIGTLKPLTLCLILCFLAFGFGGLFPPGDWYQNLNQAPWTPPNIAFPIVWFFLYGCIAVAGWQIFSHTSRLAKWLWGIQLGVNALWSWLFFGLKLPVAGLIDIVVLSGLVAFLIHVCRHQRLHLSVYLLMPYIIWLLLATSLNIFVVIYN